MRCVTALCLLLASSFAIAEKFQWSDVDVSFKGIFASRPRASLSESQKTSIRQLIWRDVQSDAATYGRDWLDQISFFSLPAGRPGIVLVKQSSGDAPNTMLWLIETNAYHSRLLISSPGELDSSGVGVQQSIHHGHHDLLVAQAMGAMRTALTYYRYDGHLYRRLGTRTVLSCSLLEGHTADDSGTCF